MLKFLKKPSVIIILVIIVIAAIIVIPRFTKEKDPEYDSIIAEESELIQEVSVTGIVKPASSADLSFQLSGRVQEVKVNVSDRVEVNQELVTLNSSDIRAQLSKASANVLSAQAQLDQARASLDAEEARLSEYRQGTRSEEIQLAETKVANAEKDLVDAQTNLVNVENKADADLRQSYDSALASIQNSVIKGKTAILTLTDIQASHFDSNSPEDNYLAQRKAEAIETLLGVKDAGKWSSNNITDLEGGAYGLVQDAVNNPIYANIDIALSETYNAIQKVRNALEAVPSISELSTTEQTSLNSEKTTVSTEISTVSSRQQTISVQKATNNSSISAAQSSVNSAQNYLNSARDELSLKNSGYSSQQIAGQEAAVRQAQANVSSKQAYVVSAQADVQNYYAQLDKTVIKSPIEGIVTKQEAKVGETVFADQAIVSVISDKKFEIEAPIAEVDIANVKVGDVAMVTLDAYGSDMNFDATVFEIDPAETIVEGVPTYKVKLQFVDEDSLIKSGMTANIDIRTAQKDGVISIPQRAVLRSNGKKTVRIVNSDGGYSEVEVQTGLRGSDGGIEILSGVSVGDEVIISIKEE